MKPTILIAGSLAQQPRRGGHTWVFLQYLIGFKRLGYRVVFVDWLSAKMCRDDAGKECSLGESLNLRYFLQVMRTFGLEDSFCLLQPGLKETIGLSREQVVHAARESEFLLNVMGFLDDPEIRAAARRKVFLDIDPGFGQMWRDLGLHDLFKGHDYFVTIGLNVGEADCTIPTCGLHWITTPQPVVLDLWPVTPPPENGPITSVASWRGLFGPIDYHGQTYGLRVHEFRKYLALPGQTGFRFDVALDIHPSDSRDLAELQRQHWNLVDPAAAAGDTRAYEAFIQKSAAEMMIAKNMYVDTHSGWFSDRSICYLAAGRPVLAQDTGLARHLPAGKGLLLFRNVEEAAEAAKTVMGNLAAHAAAAREIAAECFDSDKVLGSLVEKIAAAPAGAMVRSRETIQT